MDSATLTLLLTLAVASILMVLAMVRFSAALVAEPERPSAVKGWGLIYAAAWGVIVMVMVRGALAVIELGYARRRSRHWSRQAIAQSPPR
jgi:hypothetical protein